MLTVDTGTSRSKTIFETREPLFRTTDFISCCGCNLFTKCSEYVQTKNGSCAFKGSLTVCTGLFTRYFCSLSLCSWTPRSPYICKTPSQDAEATIDLKRWKSSPKILFSRYLYLLKALREWVTWDGWLQETQGRSECPKDELVKSFLGLCKNFIRFVQTLVWIASPATDILREDPPFIYLPNEKRLHAMVSLQKKWFLWRYCRSCTPGGKWQLIQILARSKMDAHCDENILIRRQSRAGIAVAHFPSLNACTKPRRNFPQLSELFCYYGLSLRVRKLRYAPITTHFCAN